MKIEYSESFNAFWTSGAFRKIDKVNAYRIWKREILTDQDVLAVNAASAVYAQWVVGLRKRHADRGTDYIPYVLHGSTFLNRWRDYLEERTETLHDERTPERYGISRETIEQLRAKEVAR